MTFHGINDETVYFLPFNSLTLQDMFMPFNIPLSHHLISKNYVKLEKTNLTKQLSQRYCGNRFGVKTRIAGVRSIAADLDLRNGLTVDSYQGAITDVDTLVNTFNTQVVLLSELRNRITENETVLNDFSEPMLIGVATKYGKDSNQYQMAGGKKKSLGKKPKRIIQTSAAA